MRRAAIQGAGRPALEAYFELTIPLDTFLQNRDRIAAEMKKLPIEPGS